MTQYREILRLFNLGINKTKIAESVGCSRNTVRSILKHAEELDLKWPLSPEITDEKLRDKFSGKSGPKQVRKYPDFEYIRKELLKDGVNLKLLWSEYCGNADRKMKFH